MRVRSTVVLWIASPLVWGVAGCGTTDPKTSDNPGDCTVSTFYRDVDGDGYGDPAGPYDACDAPAGHVDNDDDCDDVDARIAPGATETCDGVDQDCDGRVDEEIDGSTPWYADLDVDGYGDPDDVLTSCEQPPGRVGDAGDCDDSDDRVHPGAVDVPRDDIDQDCSGADATSLAEAPLTGDLTVSTAEDAAAFCAEHDAVTGDLRITGTLETTAALACLVEVGGDLLVTSDALTTLDLPALWWVGGDLSVVGNPVLSSLSLPALRVMDGELFLLNNATLGGASFAALELAGALTSVETAGFPVLTRVVDDVSLRAGLSLPSLTTVGGRVVAASPSLAAVALPSLETAGGVYLLSLPALAAVELGALRIVDDLVIENIPETVTVALPALQSVAGEVRVLGAGPGVWSSSLETVGGDLLVNVDGLIDVQMDSLVEVGGDVQIRGNVLERVSLDALDTVDGGIELRCPDCESVDLAGLAAVGDGGLTLSGFSGTSALELGALGSVLGDIVLVDFSAMESVDAPMLFTLSGDLALVSFPALQTVSLPSLSQLEGRLEIGDNPVLTDVDLDGLGLPLRSGVADVRDNPQLVALTIGALGAGTGRCSSPEMGCWRTLTSRASARSGTCGWWVSSTRWTCRA